MNFDKEALAKIDSLREERDYYRLKADLLQERLEDTESSHREQTQDLEKKMQEDSPVLHDNSQTLANPTLD